MFIIMFNWKSEIANVGFYILIFKYCKYPWVIEVGN